MKKSRHGEKYTKRICVECGGRENLMEISDREDGVRTGYICKHCLTDGRKHAPIFEGTDNRYGLEGLTFTLVSTADMKFR